MDDLQVTLTGANSGSLSYTIFVFNKETNIVQCIVSSGDAPSPLEVMALIYENSGAVEFDSMVSTVKSFFKED